MRKFLLALMCCASLLPSGVLEVRAARADEAAALRQIRVMSDQNRWIEGERAARSGSTLARAYYEWLNLQREDVAQDFERYESFLHAHDDWPSTRRIRANAERVMPDDLTPARVQSFFQDSDPVTGRGMILYVRTLEKEGQGDKARQTLNDWFKTAYLSESEMMNILSARGAMITQDSRRVRLNYLIQKNLDSQARTLAVYMGRGYPELVAARLALRAGDRSASDKVSRLPEALQNDISLIADRMKAARRKTEGADEILRLFRLIPDKAAPDDSTTFWVEQQALIYRLMKEQKYSVAYQVAARPLHNDRFARGQAEWMAGHIALVYLHQPGRSFRHCESLYKMSVSPLTRARAAYWAGQASVQLGYPDVGRAWYRMASAYRGNFYGQLGGLKIPVSARPYHQGPPIASMQDRADFSASELPRLARLMRSAGDTVSAELFLSRMAELWAGRGGLLRLSVDLALELKLTGVAVKISRQAASDGVDFADYVYPTLPGVGTGDVEAALVYAVIRQESGFDVEAVSPAGARGLMQLMPKTAKAVAHAEKRNHRNDWLISRPEHNVRLGSAYLGQLVEQFDSYPLAIAAYNAGPGRVNEWLRDYGDPRTGKISLIDWIERIPVYETRNYVQRVLEGTAVYRQKLRIQPFGWVDPLHLAEK